MERVSWGRMRLSCIWRDCWICSWRLKKRGYIMVNRSRRKTTSRSLFFSRERVSYYVIVCIAHILATRCISSFTWEAKRRNYIAWEEAATKWRQPNYHPLSKTNTHQLHRRKKVLHGWWRILGIGIKNYRQIISTYSADLLVPAKRFHAVFHHRFQLSRKYCRQMQFWE